MATKANRQAYIITTSEDKKVNEIADDKVGAIISNANVCDAVDVMATDHQPTEQDVMTSPEFNTIIANLTETEAKKLSRETGIKDVELDEEVVAFDDSDDLGILEPAQEDSDAAARFMENLDLNAGEFFDTDFDSGLAEYSENLSDEELMALAKLELQRDIDLEEQIDFDVDGQIVKLDEELNKIANDMAGKHDISKPAARKLIEALARELQGDIRGDINADALESKIARVVTSYSPAADDVTVARIQDYITYGLLLIYAPVAWHYTQGAGARVAVLDTGISRNHSDLRVYGGASFVPGVTSWQDDHGHGTHVAGTIAAVANNRGVVGVAPQSRVYAVKVLNGAGSGRISWILNGLAACYRARMHIVNLSLGSIASSHNRNEYSRAYERAGQQLRRRGILAVAAAGNSGRTRSPYVGNPARCPSFLAVSAVDRNARRADFSSYGPQVELAAPGVGVWSTTFDGRYGRSSGTSMAAPHVAGVAALSKARRPAMTGDQIRRRMNYTARDLGRSGRDPFYGYGLVNAYRSVR